MPQPSTSSQTILSRRPRPVEVIDVDAIPEADARPAQRRRMNTGLPQAVQPVAGPSTSARHEPIVIYDSDEEVERGLLADTPPRRPHPLMRVQPLQRLPSHRDVMNPQRFSPPPAIIPNARPFSFEEQLMNRARRALTSEPAPAAAPQAAPRSHHQPSMGLGGGLIAMNRQAAVEDAHRRRHHQPPLPQARRTTVYRNDEPGSSSSGFMSGFINTVRNMVWPAPAHHNDPEDLPWGRHLEDRWGSQVDIADHWAMAFNEDMGPPPAFPKPKVDVYEPSYTHPGTPPPGFTWDFADSESSQDATVVPSKKVIVVDEDEAAASSSSQTPPQATATLICARCMDPLVLPAQTASDEENKARRVWSLRCGHMYDGKCIAHLMRPQPEVVEVKAEPVDGALGVKPATLVDRKGKGRAVDRPAPYVVPSAAAAGSIRSRLRPRRGAGASSADIGAMGPPELPGVESSSSSRTLRASGGRDRGSVAEVAVAPAKGKGKAKKSRRQRFTWRCPVPDCGLEHVSVLPAGEEEWLMDPHKGALPMFV
ncbi:hypothetical protein PsYK624_016200 [Phanerochaete sordida]|uniref:Uncharacterized protein n=1 Tax=Phanerochaete sordida TaxID=48140 RepID=A0A9P3L7X9_9APHY|nr:hypothetical protein PsYK624_016200 [Phanerochaete sordida]